MNTICTAPPSASEFQRNLTRGRNVTRRYFQDTRRSAMRIRTTLLAAAAVAVTSAASAAIVASAVIPLNVRSGPGPQYPVVGAIPANGKATVIGCIQDSMWCQVNVGGKQAWAYSKYLAATLSGRSLAVSEALRQFPAVTYVAPAVTVGAAPPPV